MNGKNFWVIFILLQFVPQALWVPRDGGTYRFKTQVFCPELSAYQPVGEDEQLDLESDESLEQLVRIEYDKDAWSMSSAIGLSLVPGGGFGLIYVRKKPQAVVPFLLSSLGYGLGIAYLAGSFDEAQVAVCTTREMDECPRLNVDILRFRMTLVSPKEVDNQDIDPRSPSGQPYFQTQGDYRRSNSGAKLFGQERRDLDSNSDLRIDIYSQSRLVWTDCSGT